MVLALWFGGIRFHRELHSQERAACFCAGNRRNRENRRGAGDFFAGGGLSVHVFLRDALPAGAYF